jgi:hypothetical protein
MKKATLIIILMISVLKYINAQKSVENIPSAIPVNLSAIPNNDFKIGVFGESFKTQNVGGYNVPYTTPLDGSNNKTSILNVLALDGFNIYKTYGPNEWLSQIYLKNELLLAQANGMKVQVGIGTFGYYKPNVDQNGNYLGNGSNTYDNCNNSIPSYQIPYNLNYFRANINDFITNIYTVAPYKDIIWGHHICEEASFYHQMQFTANCTGNDIGNPSYFKNVEVPPLNVSNAFTYFKGSLNNNHKLVVMEANHGKSINGNTLDGEGVYNPQQYIQLLNNKDIKDVFFEGSYVQFPSNNWLNQSYSSIFNNGWHYLGSMKSIDYAKQYTSQVHKVITIEDYAYPNGQTHYHSNLNILNANWLWFQSYTSIIHGAQGVWFWGLNYAWNSNEAPNPDNLVTVWDGTIPNKYDKIYFPTNYKNYISNLASELRYLVNKNILSTDPQTIVASKTDIADVNCIVPAATSYMASLSIPSTIKNENYGLRYTIRTNGTETWMIISNPLNIAISNVRLNFTTVANPIVRNSTGVDVYFDNNANAVTSNIYKTNRNSTIDLTNLTVVSKYSVAFTGNKQLTLSFGPLDVKVIKFNGTITHYNNSWANVWSNFGSSRIDGHKVNSTDLYYTGDFDGGGDEELLCVQNTSGNNDWITLLKYDAINLKWIWLWSNYGNSSAGNGIYPYRKNFVIGDYDGDGKKELLGNDLTPGGWTTMFKFVNGNWQWSWSDNGNLSHAMRPYKDKMYAGDFNGDGKDEILGCCLVAGGWTTIFQWNGSNFVWGYWSDNGVLTHPLRPYRTNLLLGDYNGDLKTDVLGFNTWSTLFTFGPSNWNWIWSTYGATNFSGWTYPLSTGDRVISGNIDNDIKDEIMFLQTTSSAAWATTMDYNSGGSYFNWNWSGNPTSPNVPFIDDWAITPPSGASDTRYYFIKAKASEPKYLLAMRNQGCGYLVNMYKTSNPTSNYKTMLGSESDLNNMITNDNSISIYPNPAKDEVTVKFNAKDIDNTVTIMDIQGKVVLEMINQNNQEVKIDTRTFKQGVYFVKLRNNSSFTVHKLIIE